jgi:hypothetical protein
MTPKIKLPRISEHEEQVNFFDGVRYIFQHRDDFIEDVLFSIPNGIWAGGKNPYALIAKFKKEGMKPGVSDILYLQPRGGFAYLAIEMKAQDKRNAADAVKPEQVEFLEAVKQAGGMGAVCFGCDEALTIFTRYMSLPVRVK